MADCCARLITVAALGQAGSAWVFAAAIVAMGTVVERLWPARAASRPAWGFNLLCSAASATIGVVAGPLLAGVVVWATNACGGGLIALSQSGWRLWPSLVIYVLAADCLEYLFHRLQHRVAWMWAMHSLHHSDPAMSVSTTLRHFWGDPILKAMTIYLFLGVVFKVTPALIGMYAAVSMYNYFVHMNIPVNLGRWSWMVNSPAFHRVHHSSSSEHWGRNYSGLLPLFDLLFGTYLAPVKGVWPKTGLESSPATLSLRMVLLWPVRRLRVHEVAA